MSRSFSRSGSGKEATRPAARSTASASRDAEGRTSPAGGSESDGASAWEKHPLDLDESEIDPAELAEFMSDSPLDVQPDPVFKERLRQKLWRIVRERAGSRNDD